MPNLPGIGLIIDQYGFKERLEFAEKNSQAMQLERFYRRCFPGCISIEKVKDKEKQRDGIDTLLFMQSGRILYFDEKIREKEYGDILLEEYSVWKTYPYVQGREIGKYEPLSLHEASDLVVGWLGRTKKTDYITYAVVPSKRVNFLPFLLLQKAWCKHYREWVKMYGRLYVPNDCYFTTNIPVPTDKVYEAMFETERWM